MAVSPLVHDLINGGFLVTRAGHNVLVIGGDVYRQDRGCLIGLEDGGAIGGPPGIQQVVLPCGDKPLATVGKLERKDTALMQMELVLVWLGTMENLHIGVLHTNCQPVPSWTVAKTEDL